MHAQFDLDDAIYECNELGVEEEKPKLTSESLARDIYAMSGGRPKFEVGNAKPSPMIPKKEVYEALQDDINVVMRQKHAGYITTMGRKSSSWHLNKPPIHLLLTIQ